MAFNIGKRLIEMAEFVKGLINYPIEEGEKDGWTYRKWSNGFAECWRTVSGTIAVNYTWGSLATSGDPGIRIPYPTELFVDEPKFRPSIGAMEVGNYWIATASAAADGLTPGVQLCRGTAYGSCKYNLEFYIYGKWKSGGGIQPIKLFPWRCSPCL